MARAGRQQKTKARENAPPVARISIPTTTETSSEFKARIGASFASQGCHVYVDTSFLMWATKIGPASRAELLEWLRTDLGDRVHVPTWSAHEYLRHHVAGTIVDELTKRSNELSGLVGSTFGYFRPFLDDPALPAAEGWDHLRASTRSAVNSLAKLADAAKGWKRAYSDHAEKVIEFINERVLDAGQLFSTLPAINGEGAARYEGRIPPGYQDRNKKGESNDDDPDEVRAGGANRYGDLIFWKESLAHAKAVGAGGIIILTNDRKNDWRMGGEEQTLIDETMLSLKKAWRPVPRIHPMLALEAKLAGVGEVDLIDSQYLAAYLRDVDAARVGAFADVAIVPDPPPAQSEDDRREGALRRRLEEDERARVEEAAEAQEEAARDGHRFADDAEVKVSKVALEKALLKSRDGPDERGFAILQRVRADVEPVERFDDLLNAETLAGMDHVALAAMSRGLHDRVLAGEPGFGDALADLIGLLDELPPATAGAMLLGLLASTYLVAGTGESKIPPGSPALPLLFETLERPFADPAAAAITNRLDRNERRPLFAPADAMLECRFDTEAESMETDELRSVKIGGVELLVAAQAEPTLRLRDLIGADTATGGEILTQAVALFALPANRLDADGDEDSTYHLIDTIGFRAPDQVARVREEG